MRFAAFILLLSIAWVLKAQPTKHFYKGVIIDKNKEVLISELAVETAFDAVSYKTSENASAILPAHQVSSFRYYDDRDNINRKFISLRFNGRYQFYEVVIPGDFQIIRRLKKYALTWEVNERESYHFFTWYKGELKPIEKFKSTILPLFGARFTS